jgi:DNA gyrase/topoisomerase IV subunit B
MKTQETWKVLFWGDSASGSITKSRDVNTGSFSLRGKPLNSYGMNKKLFMKMRIQFVTGRIRY